MNGVKCPLPGCTSMELINRSDCFDSHIADKDLVNMYGGVAYDHESMPKVVAVHTLTPVRQTDNHGRGQHLPRMDRMPRKWYSMMIGIRSKPQDSGIVRSQRPYVDLKEHFDLLVKNKKPSFFGPEQLNQSESWRQNTTVTSPATSSYRVVKWLSPYYRTLKRHNIDPSMECNSSHDRILQEKEPESTSQICGLLLTEQKKGDDHKSSEADTEAFSVAEKLENLDWFNIGVLAENSDQQDSHQQHVQLKTDKNSQLCSEKDLTASAGSDYLQGQATESSTFDQVSNTCTSTKGLNASAGNTVRDLDAGELGNSRYEKACNATCKTFDESSLEMSLEGGDTQKQKNDCILPRKRPRKSIPRKIDIEKEKSYSGFFTSDSEATLTADELTSELSSKQCTPVVSPNSSGSDSESSRSTKVIFKRTAGIWSVSSLKSDGEENMESKGTWSSSKEMGVERSQNASDATQPLFEPDYDKQVKKIRLFTDRPIAPLVFYDPLDSSSEERCFSPALDREARIKELLSKQEKLLAETTQSRAASQNSPP